MLLATAAWVPLTLSILVFLTGVFLILLVLIQRGKGGGLVGALGGTGGSSAFGARAGDTFTKVTLGVAVLWILLNMGLVVAMQPAPKAPAEDAVTGAPPVPTETP